MSAFSARISLQEEGGLEQGRSPVLRRLVRPDEQLQLGLRALQQLGQLFQRRIHRLISTL